MSTKPLLDAEALVRKAAFRLLLGGAEPVAESQLAEMTGIGPERLAPLLERLDGAGRIRRDPEGRVVGSAGLSVVPDRHQVELEGTRFWTWCAYDILGIVGALGANGLAISPSPPDGHPIALDFVKGRPQRDDVVLFRPAEDLMESCANVYADWCPNSNLFANRELAEAWARQRGIRGAVLSIDDASSAAAEEWKPLTDGLVLSARSPRR